MLQKWWTNRRKNGGTLFQLWSYNLGKLKNGEKNRTRASWRNPHSTLKLQFREVERCYKNGEKNRRKNGGTRFQLWNYNLRKLKIWFPAIKMVFNRKIYQWRLLDKNNARATFSFAHCHLPGNDCQREWLGTSFGLRGSTVIGLLHSRVVHKCCDAVNSCNRLKWKC